MTNVAAKKHSIMVVDDEPANLKLLEDVLQRKGYEVRSFPRGRLAVAAARNRPPDLFLLDVNMPEISGYEVCERLKSDNSLFQIPVLFLSALSLPHEKLKGFRAGAVDFISKPFELEEVYARVETHLKLHDLQRALQSQNGQLEELVDLRTRELAEANERLTLLDLAKDDFLRIICHEFRTPMNGILAVSEIVLDEAPPSEETRELRKMFERSRQRVVALLDDALLLTHIDVDGERFKSAPVFLSLAVNRAIERATEFARSRRVKLEPPSVGLGLVRGEEDLLVRALHGLIDTAIKFSEDGGTVRLLHEIVPGSLRVIIDSEGRTIPDGVVDKFFDMFAISEALTPGGDLGLGPCVASRVFSLFGGTVTVENRDPPGIRLTVTF